MPRKKPAKPPEGTLQALQSTQRPTLEHLPAQESRAMQRMNRFLREFERQCGNVSSTCANIGVSRQTYYRWMTGTSRTQLRFQRKIGKIQPELRLIDAAHAVVVNKLAANDLNAAIFTLKTKGKWTEKHETVEVPNEVLTKVATAYLMWHDANQHASTEEKMRWLGMFATRAEVPPAELESAVEGMKEKKR